MKFKPSVGLFKESFRQLKIVGILGCIFYALLGILIPVGANISACNVESINGVVKSSYVYTFDITNILTVSLIVVVILVPIMMLVAFNFINKRNSCDFYHAVPVKRLPAFVGISFAVILWTIIMIAVEIFMMGIMCGILPRVRLETCDVIIAASKTFAAALFLIGVFSVGIALSGTLFTNIVVSFIVMAAPRLMILVFLTIIGSSAVYYPIDDAMNAVFTSGNVLTQFIRGLGTGNVELGTFDSVLPTVIEGLIYYAAGALIYVHRKSETAQKPSLTYAVQSVLRMTAAYLCGLAGVGFITIYFRNYRSQTYLFYAAVMFVMALLVYVVYELLTSHKWSMVGRSLKQLPILAGLLIISFVSVRLVVYKINNYNIVPERTRYIEIDDVSSSYAIDSYNIEWDKLDRKIYDKDCIYAIADAYAKNNNSQTYTDVYTDVTTCTVNIHQDGHNYRRTVELTPDVLSRVAYCITQNNDSLSGNYIKKYSNGSYIDTTYSSSGFENSQVREIYDCLKEEIEENNNLLDVLFTEYGCTIGTLYINYQDSDNGTDYTVQRIPISYKTPKALDLLVKYSKPTMSLEDYLDTMESGKFSSTSLLVGKLDNKDSSYSQWWIDYSNSNLKSYIKLIQIIEKYGKKGCVSDENAVIINGYIYVTQDNADEQYNSLCGIYTLSDEGMKLCTEALKEINNSNQLYTD